MQIGKSKALVLPYYHFIILTDQILEEKGTRIEYREKERKGSAADKDFCFRILPQGTPSGCSLWKRVPQAGRDPQMSPAHFTGCLSGALLSEGEQPSLALPPLCGCWFDHWIFPVCEQLSFCLRLVDTRLELFKENSWHVRGGSKMRNQKMQPTVFSQYNASLSTGGNERAYW